MKTVQNNTNQWYTDEYSYHEEEEEDHPHPTRTTGDDEVRYDTFDDEEY